MRVPIAISAITFALACGGGDVDGGRDFSDRFNEACGRTTNMPAAVCECLAKKAEDDLSANERAFVLATLEEDDETTARLRTELGFDGAMRAGMFMTRAAECARETSGAAAGADARTPR